jgi:hypothetical protein
VIAKLVLAGFAIDWVIVQAFQSHKTSFLHAVKSLWPWHWLMEVGILFYVILWVQVPGSVVGSIAGYVIVKVPEISS